MTDLHQPGSPRAAARKSIARAPWFAIPMAVLLGLATRYVGAAMFGESAGDYIGFAVALMSSTWLLSDSDHSSWGANAALSALAGVLGVLILLFLRYLPI